MIIYNVTIRIDLSVHDLWIRWMKEEHMPLIVDLIDEVLQNPENESVIADVRGRVNQMMEGFPMFAW